MSEIRTPDQRLRVFVSSTLRELAAERGAVLRAINALHLTPVLFELGARPHPPRELYRAYLKQSDVFVGIYGESYGWVAPGEAISGLEDEYNLAGGRAKLIYVKEPVARRDERLQTLLDRVKADAVSYVRFSDTDELERMVADDLALLLSERFGGRGGGDTAAVQRSLPHHVDTFIGREDEIRSLATLLARRDVRLVTLTGPGGIGKSRLAVEAARILTPGFPGGVTFVPFAAVPRGTDVVANIAQTLGLGQVQDPGEALATHFGERVALLLLDNLEHLRDAAPPLADLLERTMRLTILTTSRAPLGLRGEREWPVPPLSLVSTDVSEPAAVRLFVDRVRAVLPDFELGDDRDAVVEICRRLDGLPLAIELAAARVRVFSPTALLERLEHALDFRGAADLPPRQRTLRSTLDWSHSLLDDAERTLFRRLAIFTGGGALEAVHTICRLEDRSDILEVLESLAAQSLVGVVSGPSGTTRVTMLETIREYALEQLHEAGEHERLSSQHGEYYAQLATTAGTGLRGSGQVEWLNRLTGEYPNMRSAALGFISQGAAGEAIAMTWSLWPALWIRGVVHDPLVQLRRLLRDVRNLEGEATGRTWALVALFEFLEGDHDAAEASAREAAGGEDGPAALARLILDWCETRRDPSTWGHALAREARRIFDELGDAYEAVLARTVVDRSPWGEEDVAHLPEFEATVADARALGAAHPLCLALLNCARVEMRAGYEQRARASADEATRLACSLASPETLAYSLVAQAAVELLEPAGDSLRRVATLLGAADSLIRSVSLAIFGHGSLLERARSQTERDTFDAAWRFGAAMSVAEAADFALARP
ncbi:MAG: ATP-binding protein [Gaiella sp.]